MLSVNSLDHYYRQLPEKAMASAHDATIGLSLSRLEWRLEERADLAREVEEISASREATYQPYWAARGHLLATPPGSVTHRTKAIADYLHVRVSVALILAWPRINFLLVLIDCDHNWDYNFGV